MADQHAADPAPKPRVVVLGGGIAGIAAAISLLDQDYPVTLVEARDFLGGRTFSFRDRRTGDEVDNGQHVIVGCCTSFIDLLKRLGVFHRWYLQPRLRLRISDTHGKTGILAASFLPAPLHLLPSLLAYPHLGIMEKLRVPIALIRARFTDRRRGHLEEMSFDRWLREAGQSERAIRRLWNLIVMPILNDDVGDVSASMGLMVIQEGMLAGYHSADFGYARAGLLSAVGEPAGERLAAGGAELRLGSSVRRLVLKDGRVLGAELATGETVPGKIFVSALPAAALLRVLPEEALGHPYFRSLRELETSPIVNLHLWYDRPVMEEEFCAFVDSPLQWVFNKTRIMGGGDARGAGAGADLEGQYICVSVSAAWDYIDRPREELAAEFMAEMARIFPRAREAKVTQAIVVKQRHATFRCLPGANLRRPGSPSPIPNLFLAGEWTDTGWPSTMESAARSGYNAAQAVAASQEPAG